MVLLKNTVTFRNPRHYLPFSATEMEELELIPLQVVKLDFKLRWKFKNSLSSLLADVRQVSAPVHKVCQSDILSGITIPIYQRMSEAFLAIDWQGCFSITTTPTP